MGCSSEAEQVTVNHQVEICLTASSVATRQSSCKHGFVLTAPSGRNSPSQPTMPHGVMVNTMVFGAIVPGSSPGEAAKVLATQLHRSVSHATKCLMV